MSIYFLHVCVRFLRHNVMLTLSGEIDLVMVSLIVLIMILFTKDFSVNDTSLENASRWFMSTTFAMCCEWPSVA